MSFPRQQSQWVNIWGPEWHFCNSVAHNGSFVILSGRGWYDHELRLHEEASRSIIFNLSSKPPFSFSKLPWTSPLRFFTFLAHFYRFMHIWQHPLRVLRLEFVFLLGQFILWVLLTWNNTHSWGFRIYIWQHRFAFHLSFEISIFALELRFSDIIK